METCSIRVWAIVPLAQSPRVIGKAGAGSCRHASYVLQRQAKAAAKQSSYSIPNLLPALARAGLWVFAVFCFLFTLVIPYGSMLLTSLLKLLSAGPTLGNFDTLSSGADGEVQRP